MTLLCCPGHQASKPACHTAAAATVQALYLVLSKDTEQCKHLLVATHVMMDVAASEQSVTKARDSAYMQKLRKGLHVAVQALAGCLPTQLIAIACLARLCSQVSTCKAHRSSAHLVYIPCLLRSSSTVALPPLHTLLLDSAWLRFAAVHHHDQLS